MKNALFLSLLLAPSCSRSFLRSHQLYSPFSTPSSDLASLFRSTGSFFSATQETFGAIENAQDNIESPTVSMDSLYIRFPSSWELDGLIESNDSVSLLKTIQNIATDDSLSCEQKIAYLLELVGRIHAITRDKQLAASKLQAVIGGSREEIGRLQQEIKRLSAEKEELSLAEKHKETDVSLFKLRFFYEELNKLTFNLMEKEAKKKGYERDIELRSRNSDLERNRIAEERLKLASAKNSLSSLQQQLKQALETESYIKDTIADSQQKITANEEAINIGRRRVTKKQGELASLQNKVDLLKARYTFFEIKVERLRTGISTAEAKEDALNAQIQRNQQKIHHERKKVVEDELSDLKRMVGELETITKKAEASIDEHYYECYGDGRIQVEQTGSVTTFIIKGESVGAYLHRSYGKSVKVPERPTDTRLHKLDIFAPEWTNKYGYPNISHSKAKFDCLVNGFSSQGYGTITKIKSDGIWVEHGGKTSQLVLKQCSRLESDGGLPQIGKTLYWSGRGEEDRYVLESGTCL